MSRDINGTYTLPAGNPVVTGTTILSSWANTTFTDVGTELTSSLDRSARGGMLAALRLFDGSAAVPGLSFVSETSTGFYRAGANDIRLSIASADKYLFGVNVLTAQAINVLGATAPANGMYLGAANSLSFTTATTLRLSIGATGNCTLAAPTSGASPTLTLGNFAGGTALSIPAQTNAVLLADFGSLSSGSNSVRFPLAFAIGNSTGAYPYAGYNWVPVASSATANYVVADLASRMQYSLGGFVFQTAPAGTPGNPITFTNVMSITQGGNVSIAGPAAGVGLSVLGNNGSAVAVFAAKSAGVSQSGYIQLAGTDAASAAVNYFIGPNAYLADGSLDIKIGGRGLNLNPGGNVLITAPAANAALTVNALAGVGTPAIVSVGVLAIQGNQGLAASYGSTIAIVSSDTGSATRIIFGDGSGWSFNLSKRLASVTTDLFRITDTGDITARGVAFCKFKAADQNKTATIVAANDTDLIYAVPGAGTYAVEMLIFIRADATSSAGGIRYGVNYSGSATAASNFTSQGMINSVQRSRITQTISTPATYAPNVEPTIAPGGDWLMIAGVLTATGAGTLGFDWAQNSSTGGSLTISAGSWMQVTQLS